MKAKRSSLKGILNVAVGLITILMICLVGKLVIVQYMEAGV